MSILSSHQPSPLDLDELESDPRPVFLIKIGPKAIQFELVYCNEAFRTAGLRNVVLAEHRDAILFRSWTQAIHHFKVDFDFDNRNWSAEIAGGNKSWKIIRAVRAVSNVHKTEAPDAHTQSEDDTLIRKPSENKLPKRLDPNTSVPVPRANINARWESLQTMMELTDVGVFEYDPTGKLIHANDAWYRLRYVYFDTLCDCTGI
jgi:PAS domain-containing protein